MTAGPRHRVLLADDSVSQREALCALLGAYPDLEVVGQACDGVEAVELAKRLRPDVITMDIQMPRLDGLGATAEIMTEAPSRILVVASVTPDQQDLSFRAIAAGALEVIPKPSAGVDPRRWGRQVADAIRLMSEVPVVRRRRSSPSPARFSGDLSQTVDVFGLVASTGGPPALAEVLGALPRDLPIPVLVAQHLAPGFTSGLLRWLAESTDLEVRAARDGEIARGGHAYFPPDGHHLEVDPEGALRVIAGEARSVCPSGDRLLASVARAYGARAGAAVLTGMGDDGARGLFEIHRAGGITAAQDAATSVVFGMPEAARASGATDLLLPISVIATLIREVSRPFRASPGGSR